MEFRVPQYIDVEERLFGPLTVSQGVFLAGGIGIGFLLLRLAPLFVAVPLLVPIGYLTWALAFYPKDRYGKSFASLMESGFRYYTRSRLYTWKQDPKKKAAEAAITFSPKEPAIQDITVPKITEGKLKNMEFSIGLSKDEGSVADTDHVDRIRDDSPTLPPPKESAPAAAK